MHLVHTRLRCRTSPSSLNHVLFREHATLHTRFHRLQIKSNLGLKIRGIRNGESRRVISPTTHEVYATAEICLYQVYEQHLLPGFAACWINSIINGIALSTTHHVFGGVPRLWTLSSARDSSELVRDCSRLSEGLRTISYI
jgi:hypothetical protein